MHYVAILIDRGRIADCNDKAALLLGFTERASLIGQRPDDISPQRQPDGRLSSEKAEAMMARALAKGNARFEWVHKSVDGTPVPVEVVLTKIAIEGNTTAKSFMWSRLIGLHSTFTFRGPDPRSSLKWLIFSNSGFPAFS